MNFGWVSSDDMLTQCRLPFASVRPLELSPGLTSQTDQRHSPDVCPPTSYRAKSGVRGLRESNSSDEGGLTPRSILELAGSSWLLQPFRMTARSFRCVEPVCGRRPLVLRTLQIYRPPPYLGEHTEEILEELGYSASDVDRLRQDGVV